MSEPGFASLGPSLLARKGGAKPAMRPQVAPLVADQSAIAEEQLEDLGWNDMGDAGGDPGGDMIGAGGADIVPINAGMTPDLAATGALGVNGGPIVRRQQRRLEERVLADAAMTGPDDHEAEYDEDDAEEDAAETGAFYGNAGYAEDAEDDADFDDSGDPGGADYSPLMVHSRTKIAAPVAAPSPRAAPLPAAQAGRRAAFTLRLDADRHLKLRLAATMQGVSAQALVTEALDRLLAEYDELDIIANHLKRH